MKEIKFYHEYEDYGFLSNYYLVNIIIDNITYKSVEHYYQSQKTLENDWAERIINSKTCAEAKALGNSPNIILRIDWDTWKLTAMRRGLRAKFSQHNELQRQLLETKSAILMENSMDDYYWGIGIKGTGKNMLGKLLMELRDDIIAVQ